MIKKLAKAVAVIGFIMTMVGCSTIESGKPINYLKLERLTLGISTQETVKEVFGYPQEIIYPDNRTVYKYRYYRKSSFSEDRHAVDFAFNHNQRLIDITVNDAINMQEAEEK